MASPLSKAKPNLRSTAVKRIMQEAAELARDAEGESDFVAAPLEEDLFDWHCTMKGIEGTEFEGGIYHFRIVLPPQYPMNAPDIILLTPNGRFETGKKICIDGLTSFHAGSWQPAWGVRTAILGLRSFWTQKGEALAAVGAIDAPKEERRRLAQLSKDWTCPCCGVANHELLPDVLSSKGEGNSTGSGAVELPPSLDAAETAITSQPVTDPALAKELRGPHAAATDTAEVAIPQPESLEPVHPPAPAQEEVITEEAITRLEPRISPAELAALTAQLPRSANPSPRVPIWIDTCLVLAILAFAILVARRVT